MELFQKANAVRLRSHHDKYLLAEDDEESVCQDRNGSSRSARWTVEFIDGNKFLRLKSCYGRYLAASNIPFLLGMTGRKVLQTLPRRLDSSVEWEPLREGFHVKLRTRYGNYLRANGGLPPWRNSITHDIPHRSSTQDWVLWEVDIVEIQVESPVQTPKSADSSLDSRVSEDKSGSMSSEMSPKLSKLKPAVCTSRPMLWSSGMLIQCAIPHCGWPKYLHHETIQTSTGGLEIDIDQEKKAVMSLPSSSCAKPERDGWDLPMWEFFGFGPFEARYKLLVCSVTA